MKIAELRTEHQLISEWITDGARVLDLGCGDGGFLAALNKEKSVTGYGIEIDPENIVKCIQKGVNVIQANLDEGLSEFEESSFDFVVMTQTIQALRSPHSVIKEILRIGKEGIVTFPNVGHWRCRLQFMLGKMPITRQLPESWHETPNIHICSIKDFEELCNTLNITISERAILDAQHRPFKIIELMPNLFGEIAIYRTCLAT